MPSNPKYSIKGPRSLKKKITHQADMLRAAIVRSHTASRNTVSASKVVSNVHLSVNERTVKIETTLTINMAKVRVRRTKLCRKRLI